MREPSSQDQPKGQIGQAGQVGENAEDGFGFDVAQSQGAEAGREHAWSCELVMESKVCVKVGDTGAVLQSLQEEVALAETRVNGSVRHPEPYPNAAKEETGKAEADSRLAPRCALPLPRLYHDRGLIGGDQLGHFIVPPPQAGVHPAHFTRHLGVTLE